MFAVVASRRSPPSFTHSPERFCPPVENTAPMDVGIVAQKGNARAATLADELRAELADLEATPHVDAVTADALDVAGVDVSAMGDCDLVVTVGGDGTFLFAARGADGTPILGVNLGEVGFLNPVGPADAVDAVRAAVERFRTEGAVRTRELDQLQATGEDWSLPSALNEVVVAGPRRGHGGGATVEVRVDGTPFSGTHADGVLVATPTGSTAYNLSEGGPLVHPAVDAAVVTQMCAGEPMPPLVVGADSEVTVRVEDAPAGWVVGDGRARHRIEPPATVTVRRADEPVRVAGPPVDFFEALRKLE